MFEFSMIKLVRRYPTKLDRELRQSLVNLYQPFSKIPCVAHKILETILKRGKKHAVIIEFDNNNEKYNDKITTTNTIVTKHLRSKIKHHFSNISCCSAELTPAAIEALLENHKSIKKIHTDRKVRALLDIASLSVNAEVLHAQTIKGEGVTIAVVDTGIYPHQDLQGRIIAFKDFINNRKDPYDDNGHGTHCAGDAAGDGSASNGKYTGIAPAASLVGVKVLDKMGAGLLSNVISGIQWCMDHQEEYGIDVISLSLGANATVPAEEDPMVTIVEAAWDAGIVVCVAAGNEGPDQNTIASPGISPTVITVGAMDDRNTEVRADDQVATFSSRGPTIDGLIKPDVLSPGVNIISLRSPNSYLDKLSKSNRVGKDYLSLSGTSMATPICAGIVALILEIYPNMTPNFVKQIVMSAADDWSLPPNVQGAGYINAQNVKNAVS